MYTYHILKCVFLFIRLQIHNKELEDMRSRDNFIMKEIRVDTMKRNVETLDRLTIQLQEAMKELQVGLCSYF